MLKIALPAIVVTTLLTLLPAASLANDDLVDPIVDHFLSELASRQGFIRLATLSDEGAKIGSLYWVSWSDIRCGDELRQRRNEARALPVQYLEDLPEQTVTLGSVKGWTSIRIDKFVGTDAVASISAKLPGKKGELAAAVDFLKQSNAQITFGVLERKSFPLRRAATQFLLSQGIEKPSDMASEASGLLIPYAQLVLQSFKYDSNAVKSGEASVGASFLNLFGGRLEAKGKTIGKGALELPTNAVFAFKADYLMLPEKCPSSPQKL